MTESIFSSVQKVKNILRSTTIHINEFIINYSWWYFKQVSEELIAYCQYILVHQEIFPINC